MSMKIVTIIGTRPQFIKAATVSRELKKKGLGEILIHTGQHFEKNMSQIFFDELGIPKPHHNLNISGGSHGDMTARMLTGIEGVLITEKPDWVLIYGDTNSTLAGALAASKLHIPIAHIESGLRSYNMRMPEEVNRIVADRISTLHFCPSDIAVQNLKSEGLTKAVHNVGDVMYDAALLFSNDQFEKSSALTQLDLKSGTYALATCHRAENTDEKQRLENILSALDEIASHMKVIFPLHPRTRKCIDTYDFSHYLKNLVVTEPLSYVDMLWLEKNAKVIITDSGGMQKEAFFFNVPCVTIRDETEWVETVEMGANILAGTSKEKIINYSLNPPSNSWSCHNVYGNGQASNQIADILMRSAEKCAA